MLLPVNERQRTKLIGSLRFWLRFCDCPLIVMSSLEPDGSQEIARLTKDVVVWWKEDASVAASAVILLNDSFSSTLDKDVAAGMRRAGVGRPLVHLMMWRGGEGSLEMTSVRVAAAGLAGWDCGMRREFRPWKTHFLSGRLAELDPSMPEVLVRCGLLKAVGLLMDDVGALGAQEPPPELVAR